MPTSKGPVPWWPKKMPKIYHLKIAYPTRAKLWYIYFVYTRRDKICYYIVPSTWRPKYAIHEVPSWYVKKYALFIVPSPKVPKYVIFNVVTWKVAQYASYIVPTSKGQNMPFIWCLIQNDKICHLSAAYHKRSPRGTKKQVAILWCTPTSVTICC